MRRIHNFRVAYLGIIFATIWSNIAYSAEVEILVTDRGIQFFHIEMNSIENVVVQASWPSYWLFDNSKNPMVPFVAIQLIYSSSAEGMDIGILANRLEELQVQRGMTAGVESVTGSLVAPVNSIEEGAELLNMILINPDFNADQQSIVKQNIQSQMHNLRSGIDATAWELARNLILQDNPVKRFFSTSLDNIALVGESTISEVIQFFRKTVTQSNNIIVVASPFDSDRASQVVDRMFDGIPVGDPIEVLEPIINFPYGKTVVLHDPDVERSYMAISGPLPPVSSGREYEDIMALVLLGQGGTSEIYDALRPQLGSSYEFSSSVQSLTRGNRILQIAGSIDTDKLEFAHRAILDTYSRFRTNGPQSSIDGIRRRFAETMQTNMENPTLAVSLVMESVINDFPASRALNVVEEIEAITLDELQERLRGAFPLVEQLLTVIVTSNPNLIPGACVIEDPQEFRECL